MDENKIILSTNLFDMLKNRIAPSTQLAFEFLGTQVPIVENKTLERNSIIAIGEPAELFFNAFLGVLNQKVRGL